MIEITNIAYAAGLLDGEGYIGVRPYTSGRSYNGGNFTPAVTIANTNFEVMEWLVKNFGGHVNGWSNKKTGQRRVYHWVIGSLADITTFLTLVKPFVIIKREQLELMLIYCSFGKSVPAYHDALLYEARADIYWDMKQLNGNRPVRAR